MAYAVRPCPSPRTGRSGNRRRLAVPFGKGLVDARPGWRLRRPDRCGRPRNVGIVESACPHKDQMRTRFGFTEQMRSATWTEAPMHLVATVGDAIVVAHLTGNRHASGREADADSSIAGGDELAQATPAKAGGDGLAVRLVANGATQASTGNHCLGRSQAAAASLTTTALRLINKPPCHTCRHRYPAAGNGFHQRQADRSRCCSGTPPARLASVPP
jgi:hypothetical protein